jgi:hypothetical protein
MTREEPGTAAGRRLLEDTFWTRSPNEIRRAIEAALPAIEAEARAEAQADFEALGHSNVSYLLGRADALREAAERVRVDLRIIDPRTLGGHSVNETVDAVLAILAAEPKPGEGT